MRSVYGSLKGQAQSPQGVGGETPIPAKGVSRSFISDLPGTQGREPLPPLGPWGLALSLPSCSNIDPLGLVLIPPSLPALQTAEREPPLLAGPGGLKTQPCPRSSEARCTVTASKRTPLRNEMNESNSSRLCQAAGAAADNAHAISPRTLGAGATLSSMRRSRDPRPKVRHDSGVSARFPEAPPC